MTNVNNAVKAKLVDTGAAFGDKRRTSIASLKAEVVERFKPRPLSKAEVLAALEDKATTLLACSKASGIPVEKEGLASQAHALREAVRLLGGAK